MTILNAPKTQLLENIRYKFVRGDGGFAFGEEPQTHSNLRNEIHEGEIPFDAGWVGRVDKGVYWFGTSSYFMNSFGVPTPEERENTIREAQIRFPGLEHKRG